MGQIWVSNIYKVTKQIKSESFWRYYLDIIDINSKEQYIWVSWSIFFKIWVHQHWYHAPCSCKVCHNLTQKEKELVLIKTFKHETKDINQLGWVEEVYMYIYAYRGALCSSLRHIQIPSLFWVNFNNFTSAFLILSFHLFLLLLLVQNINCSFWYLY